MTSVTRIGTTYRFELGINGLGTKYNLTYKNSIHLDTNFDNGYGNNRTGIGYAGYSTHLAPKLSVYHKNTYLFDFSAGALTNETMILTEKEDDTSTLHTDNVRYLSSNGNDITTLTSTDIGSGATATATLNGGAIQSITVENKGSQYTQVPRVTIIDLTNAAITPATATAVVNGAGEITAINLNAGGSDYVTPYVIIGDVLEYSPTVDSPNLWYGSTGTDKAGNKLPNGTDLIDVKILVNIDVSGSVGTGSEASPGVYEYSLIKDGIKAGWGDPRVEGFIRDGGYRKVLFGVNQWQDTDKAYNSLGWMLVDLSDVDVKFHQLSPAKINGENTNSFAATVNNILSDNFPRVGGGGTDNGSALHYSTLRFYDNIGAKYHSSRNEIIHVPDADTTKDTYDWKSSMDKTDINRVNVIAIDKAAGEADFLSAGTKTDAHLAVDAGLPQAYNNKNLSPWAYTMESQKANGPTGASRFISSFQEFSETFVLILEGAITNTIPCLLEGTIITTDQGKLPIEKLTIKNTIRGMKLQLVDFSNTDSVNICRIPKNWFGVNKPNQDLLITKGHAIARDFNKPDRLQKEYLSAGKFSFNKLSNNLKTGIQHKVYHIRFENKYTWFLANNYPVESLK